MTSKTRSRKWWVAISAALVVAIALAAAVYGIWYRSKYTGPEVNTNGVTLTVPKSVPLLSAIGSTVKDAESALQIPGNPNVLGEPIVVPLNSETDASSALVSQICFNQESRKLILEVANKGQLDEREWKQAKQFRNMSNLARLSQFGCSTDPLVTALNVSE